VKSIALILSYLSSPVPRRNLRVVLGLLATLVVLVALFSVVFTSPVRNGSAQVEARAPTRRRPCPADASLVGGRRRRRPGARPRPRRGVGVAVRPAGPTSARGGFDRVAERLSAWAHGHA
jgi:hypothetical protein